MTGNHPIDRPLELRGADLRGAVLAALDQVVRYVDTLPEQPASDLPADGGHSLVRLLGDGLPETGGDLEPLLDLVFSRLAPVGFNTAGPGYLAFIPGGGLPLAAVADLIAGVVNRYVGVFAAAPGLAALEAQVVRWFCDLAGLPRAAGGFLTTGGSLANFSAVVAARRKVLGEELAGGVLYASDQAHHSVAKAAMLAGFPASALRVIGTDARYRMDLDALDAAIATDLAAGRRPFLVVASAGTTNTGAVDDLNRVGEIVRRRGMWLHVDAAYGGFFLLTGRGRRVLAGIEAADSITLDPHKGLFLPYGTGCLIVRDRDDLRRAHALSGEYMPAMQEDEERVDFCAISPELSREWRGLRVWLPLKMHGAGPFRASLDEKLDLAAYAAERLRACPYLEIVAEPELSLVTFRLRRRGPTHAAAQAEEDRRNRELLDRVNARRRVMLTGTTLRGGFVVRICVLSFRTHRDRIEEALAAIEEEAARLSG